jgi:hypothetical protein
MKKSITTHIVVMIVAIVLGWYLSLTLNDERSKITKVENEISQAPVGGFNKFVSDVQWMLFINYCGGLESVKTENVEEIYKRLNSILANDPNHEAAYEMGGMMFNVRDPKKAVEIFSRATDNPNLKNNWKLPFYAGFVLTQHMTDADDPLRLEKAEVMFRKAIARNASMPHIFSALIRTRAKKLMKNKQDKDGTPIVNAKHAYLCALLDEYRKGGGTGNDTFAGGSTTDNDLRPMLLLAAQKAKASDPKNKNILKTIKKVMDKVLSADKLCAKCLSHYAAGDKFCSPCGARVVIYGICKSYRCGNVLKGEFCSKCGRSKSNPAKKITKLPKKK